MTPIEKDKIRSIIRSYRLKSIREEEEEQLVNIFYEITDTLIKEDEEWKATVATKEDTRMVMEMMDKRFEAQQREMDKRFNAVDKRFEAVQKSIDQRFEAMDQRFESMQQAMNERFEAMQKSIDQRFESMQREMDRRFESMDKRFEDLNNRFNSMQWLIGVGFSLLAILLAVFRIF